MYSRAGNLSLTPVMTAPLDQLRDTSRKDSNTALKPMTATGELDSLNSLDTGQQLLTFCPAPRTGSPVSHEGFQDSSEGGATLSPSLYPLTTPTQLPPSLSSRVWGLPTPSPQKICNHTHPVDSCWGLIRVPSTCASSGFDYTSAQGKGWQSFSDLSVSS